MRARSLTLACSLAVVLAACGGGDDGTGGPADTTAGGEAASEAGAASGTRTPYPLTIENCGRPITFEGPPERVLILNGTSVAEVESFIALGLEDRIVANSQSYGQSDVEGMVDKIAALPTGGIELNENFEVPKEQVLALEPDLVISTWAGGFSESMGSATREELDQLGINSYVTPVNCAYGAEEPRPEDQAVYDGQTYEASFQLLEQLGLIFDVQDRAAAFIDDARARIGAVEPPDGDPVHVLVAYPGMSMMNATGAPMVFAGPLTDSIIEAAGGVNAFDGVPSFAESANINVEALAAADVDVLVIGLFMPGEDAATYAEQLFAQFPQWDAAKDQRYASIAESFYLGPYNAVGIEKIAAVVAEAG